MRNKFKELYDSPLFMRGAINTAIALAFMAVYGFLCRYSPISPVWSGLAVGAMYLGLTILTAIMFRYLGARISLTLDNEIKPMLGNITLDLIVKLWMPVIICDESGKIICITGRSLV